MLKFACPCFCSSWVGIPEDKLVPYEACCKVLGVELNLTRTPTGVASVCNTALAARNFCYSSSKSWTLGACRNQMPRDSAQGDFNLLPTTCLAGGSAIASERSTRTSAEGSRTSLLRTPRGSVHSVISYGGQWTECGGHSIFRGCACMLMPRLSQKSILESVECF